MEETPVREHVRLVLELYKQGLGCKPIARELKSRGLPGNNRSVKNWLIAAGVYAPQFAKSRVQFPEAKLPAPNAGVKHSKEWNCPGCNVAMSGDTKTPRMCKTCAPDQAARNRFKSYSIVDADYLTLLERQEHRCGICRRPLAALAPGEIHIDHCHKTGRVRGILCKRCNTGLYLFEDEALRNNAITYVTRS